MSNKIQELENQNLPSKIEKVLVVGSWAKEQATIENLKENKEIKVLSYLDTKNPGIIREADDYRIGELDQTQKIVEYASQNKVDLVLITTAEPLGKGVVDALERESILCFAPRKKAAQLETNKHFARRLMKKHNIDAVPSFKVFQQEDEAIKYAKELNWQVAVKPIGLTEGLGVKVYKEQLQTPEEVQDYIHKVLEKKIGNAAKVLVEEKMEGEEFTIHVKGMVPAGFEVRGIKGMALAFAVAPRGADHLTSCFYALEMGGDFWDFENYDRTQMEGKALALKAMEDLMTLYDMTGVCKFTRGIMYEEGIRELVNAVTGFDFSNSEIMAAGERVYNLSKAFNVREGFSREDDSLPRRVIEEEVPDGPSQGESIDRDEFERELDRYYTVRGWDEAGIPLKNTLNELDLREISEEIGVTAELTISS